MRSCPASSRRVLGMMLGTAVAVAMGACGGHRFHEHYEAGRYGQAITAFRADSALLRDQKALFRVGMLYARPGTSHYEPDLAARYLSRLLQLHPGTSYAVEARSVLALLEQTETLDRQARRLISQLVAETSPDPDEAPPGEAFHRYFEAGRYEEALAAFRADSAIRREETALYRAGVLYARPGTRHYEPDLAARYLGRLLRLHPATPYAEEARSVLALLDRVGTLDRRARSLRDQLEALKAVDLGDTLSDTTRLRRRR